jgi:hypothetical protein
VQCLDRKDNLYAHVLSLMHDLTINKHLISADSVALRICRIRSRGDLYLAPLTIGRHQFALGREAIELLVDALLLNTTLSLDKW